MSKDIGSVLSHAAASEMAELDSSSDVSDWSDDDCVAPSSLVPASPAPTASSLKGPTQEAAPAELGSKSAAEIMKERLSRGKTPVKGPHNGESEQDVPGRMLSHKAHFDSADKMTFSQNNTLKIERYSSAGCAGVTVVWVRLRQLADTQQAELDTIRKQNLYLAQTSHLQDNICELEKEHATAVAANQL